ncbi:DUF6368 family protein [Nocardia sp. NPDC049149]|uniref:DUF6368 family protein n=1 Tax=Nocardia sp. NPDC049149 TaxID=3364315 RepID=UPI0037105EA6
MGGPVAMVLLREPIDAEKVRSLMTQAFLPAPWEDDWILCDPSAFGMPEDLVDASYTAVVVRPPHRADPRLATAIGFTPAAKITLSMGANRPVDHRLIGHLCLVLALEYDGLIDFCGSLVPIPWPDDIPFVKRTREQEAELARRIAHGMRKLPGRLYLVDRCHIGDVEFLEAWLRHPRFRMIK